MLPVYAFCVGNLRCHCVYCSVESPKIIDWPTILIWIGILAVISVALLEWYVSRNKRMTLYAGDGVSEGKKGNNFYNFLNKHLLWISVCVFIAGLLIYLVGFYRDKLGVVGGWLAVVPRAIIAALKMFGAAHELPRVASELQLDWVYMSLFSVIHFIAAFISVFFLFNMIGYKMNESIKLRRCAKKYTANKRLVDKCAKWLGLTKNEEPISDKVHIFWGVNEASCLQASEIRRNDKKLKSVASIIIVIDVDEDTNDNTKKKATLSRITNTITIKDSERRKLEEVGAYVDHCYDGPARLSDEKAKDIFGSLNLRSVGKIVENCKIMSVYFLSDDEEENMTGALKMLKDTKIWGNKNPEKNSPTSNIYVHARRNACNEVLDHYSYYDDATTNVADIKIIDSAYLSVVSLMSMEKALPVSCLDIDFETGLCKSTRFTSMVVGFGTTGQSAFDFLYEFSALVGADGRSRIPFKCYAIDRNMNQIAGTIRKRMPQICDHNKLELINDEVNTDSFWRRIGQVINDLNYVVVTLNDDELGFSLAIDLYKFALQYRTSEEKLVVAVRCYERSRDNKFSDVIRLMSGAGGCDKIHIIPFGDKSDLYGCNVTLSNKILKEAKEFHHVYNNKKLADKDKQWEKDFGKEKIESEMKNNNWSRYHAICSINCRVEQNISNALHQTTKLILLGIDRDKITRRLRIFNEFANNRKPYTLEYDLSKIIKSIDKAEFCKYVVGCCEDVAGCCEDVAGCCEYVARCYESVAKLLVNVAIVEHERWMASHELRGFTYNEKGKDYIRKYHNSMLPFYKLKDDRTRSYDCDVVDTTIRLLLDELNHKMDN